MFIGLCIWDCTIPPNWHLITLHESEGNYSLLYKVGLATHQTREFLAWVERSLEKLKSFFFFLQADKILCANYSVRGHLGTL